MKKVRIHLTLDEDNIKLLNEYKTLNNCSYSEAINEIIEKGLNISNLYDEVIDIKSIDKKIYSNTLLITELLKQIYSDFGIEELTDPNKSKPLQEFFKKRKINKYE